MAFPGVRAYELRRREPICEWAERELVLPSSEARAGKLRLAPYQREILDAFTNPRVSQITLMAASQTGKTLMLMAMLGYAMSHNPRQMLMVSPREADTRRFVRTKFTPLHAASPALREITRRAKGQRYGGWSFSRIEYAGGALSFAHSGSPASMRSSTAGYTFADEVDMYSVANPDAENPLDQIKQRMATYGGRAKLTLASTPIHETLSLVWREYQAGSRARFEIPCLTCGGLQPLTDDNIIDGANDLLRCVHCDGRFGDSERRRMIERGRWIHSDPGNPRKSYHLPQLASPFVRLSETLGQRDTASPIFWSHAIMALPYSGDANARIDEDAADLLWTDKTPFADESIDWTTAGVDVQGNRLEITVVDWARARAFVRAHHIVGYAADSPVALRRAFERAGDVLESERTQGKPFAAFIDSGYLTSQVHDGVRRMRTRKALGGRICPAKGYAAATRGSFGMELIAESKLRTHNVPAYTTAPDEGKLLAYQMATNAPPLIAVNRAVGDEWMRQFAAERLVDETLRTGAVVKRWVKTRARNEALDCFVLALCANRLLEIERLRDRRRKVA